jgi:hypothetical protein
MRTLTSICDTTFGEISVIAKNVVATAMGLLASLTLQECNLVATATQTINTTRQGQKTSVLLAQSYYDTCPRAEPVRLFETKNYWLSICKGSNNVLFYRGVRKADRNQGINVENVRVIDGYTYRIRNGSTEYKISKQALVVVQNGKVILKEKVIRVK